MGWIRRNYKKAAFVAGSLLAVACPMLAAPYNLPCSVVVQVLGAVQNS